MRRMASILAIALGIAAADTAPAWAQDAPEVPELSEREDAALEMAESWMELIAAGEYEESWAAASQQFQDAVTAEVWAQQAGSIDGQLGELESRRLESAEYTTEVPNAPAGEYVVLTFESAFGNLPAAREIIALVLEDEEWRVTGYFVQPVQE